MTEVTAAEPQGDRYGRARTPRRRLSRRATYLAAAAIAVSLGAGKIPRLSEVLMPPMSPTAIIGGLLLLINLGAGDFAIEQKKRI